LAVSSEAYLRIFEMKPVLAFASLILAALLARAEVGDGVSLVIFGSVEKPARYVVKKDEATLATLIERAGGVVAWGSDHIHVVATTSDGARFSRRIRAAEFYAQDIDYVLPEKTEVMVLDCAGLGLGNLTPAGYKNLQEKRTLYLRRKQAGKVVTMALSLRLNHADKAPEPTR
jgi:hypothetical protein